VTEQNHDAQFERIASKNGVWNGAHGVAQDGSGSGACHSSYDEQHPLGEGGYGEYGYGYDDDYGAEGGWEEQQNGTNGSNRYAQPAKDQSYEHGSYAAEYDEAYEQNSYADEYANGYANGAGWYSGGDDDGYGQPPAPAAQDTVHVAPAVDRVPDGITASDEALPTIAVGVGDKQGGGTDGADVTPDGADATADGADGGADGADGGADGADGGADERKRGLLSIARSRYKERKEKKEKKKKGVRICVQVQGVKDVRWFKSASSGEAEGGAKGGAERGAERGAEEGAGTGEPLVSVAMGKHTEHFLQPQSLRHDLGPRTTDLTADERTVRTAHLFNTEVVFEGVDVKRALIISLANVCDSSAVAKVDGTVLAVGKRWKKFNDGTVLTGSSDLQQSARFAESKVPLRMAVEKTDGMRGWVPVYDAAHKSKHSRKKRTADQLPVCVGAVLLRCFVLADENPVDTS
jgi:hypothetical protein